MPILGLRPWCATTETGDFNYGPDGACGSQIFFYQALEQRTLAEQHHPWHHSALNMTAQSAFNSRCADDAVA